MPSIFSTERKNRHRAQNSRPRSKLATVAISDSSTHDGASLHAVRDLNDTGVISKRNIPQRRAHISNFEVRRIWDAGRLESWYYPVTLRALVRRQIQTYM